MKVQEMFDKVALHLLKQGKRSVGQTTGNCQYRGKDGLMCAVGCLIPDQAYKRWFDEDMEPAEDLMQHGNLREYLVPDDMREYEAQKFLRDLQGLHDRGAPEDWPDQLFDIAENYNLSPMVIVNFQDQN